MAHGNIQIEGIEYDQRAGISLLMNLIVTTTSTNSAESVSASDLVVSSVVNMFAVTDHSNQPQLVVVFSSCFGRLTHRSVIDKTAAQTSSVVPTQPCAITAHRNMILAHAWLKTVRFMQGLEH